MPEIIRIMSGPKYFNPYEDIAKSGGNLPHWNQAGVMTFVTFRLVDSLPADFWSGWNRRRIEWLATHPEPRSSEAITEYREVFLKPLRHRLDSGYGSQVLLLPEVADIVSTALRHYEGERLTLDSFVVASNHVHALFAPIGTNTISEILRSIKGFTGRRILQIPEARRRLAEHQLGREIPQVWQKEYFDHLVRSPESLEKFRAYIQAHHDVQS